MNAAVMKAEVAPADNGLSHNQLGQRIGRKGRDTRERIIAAAEALLADLAGPPITLSAVAREASLGMTSLYSYFRDLSELMGAVLEPVMASSEDAYVRQIRTYWPDEELAERCRGFVEDYFQFWSRHARILHLRNTMSDQGDERMLNFRQTNTAPLFNLFLEQTEAKHRERLTAEYSQVTVLITALERSITVLTHPNYPALSSRTGPPLSEADQAVQLRLLLAGQAWLLETAIAAARRQSRAAA